MSKETQLQRIVRKKRTGVWRGGSIAVHFNGYNIDMFWGNKRGFIRETKHLADHAENIWEIISVVKKGERNRSTPVNPSKDRG